MVDATLYKQIVGPLRYICNSTLDISYGVGPVNQFISDPRAPHLTAAKHIIRYLKDTIELGLCFQEKQIKMKGLWKSSPTMWR